MWTLEALKRDYRIALVAGGCIDLGALNAFYGTSVDCETVEVPIPWPLDQGDWGAALRGAFVQRRMIKNVARFDVLLSAYNIARFGRPALHHLADFSWDDGMRLRFDQPPFGFRRIFHTTRILRQSYLGVSRMIEGRHDDLASSECGRVLANSHWSKDLLWERYGIESQVIYPPVMMTVPSVSLHRKVPRFVSLGRIYPEKRIEVAIQILKAVRARGHRDLTLHIIGDTRETAYGRRIEEIARAEAEWLVLEGRQFGESKALLLAESAYAIHSRPGEAFGIAVAEMITAGCIPFVPAEGGPAEIVEHNPALVYSSPESAIQKISEVLENPGLECQLRDFVKHRAEDFSTGRFERDIRRVVAEFIRKDDEFFDPLAARG